MDINKLWWSDNEGLWLEALDSYWNSNLLKSTNLSIEKKFDNLDPVSIKDMTTEKFYSFLYNEYFVWKYTSPKRLATTRNQLKRFKIESRENELERIHQEMFTFDFEDIREGLDIVRYDANPHGIHGLGVAGASGLLAVLFPRYFGTVDQFMLKALCEIELLPEKNQLQKMIPKDGNWNNKSVSVNEGVILITIMKNKASELNGKFDTDKWMPREIDKILWSIGR